MKTSYFFVFVSFFCIFSSVVSAGPVYVDISAMGNNDGTSWADAYTSIQRAINDTAEPNEIIVAEGIYVENLNMKGKEIILRSMAPDDPNVVASTILDGNASGSVITCTSGETENTVIAGFWIRNGKGYSSGNGGGVYCQSASPTIKQCVFIDNEATGSYGGAIFCYSADPKILNCKFIGNSINNYGGAIACYNSDSVIANCLFSGNDGKRGGAISCTLGNPSLINCTFSQNTSVYGGGAIYCSDNGNPTITNCILWGDSSTEDSADEVKVIGSLPIANYTVVEGGWAGSGNHNLIVNPSYIDPDGADDVAGTPDDDLYVDGYSVCINAGDPNESYAGQQDISGYDRVLYSTVDIGAYEVFPVGGDLDADGQVELADIVLFADGDMWLTEVFLEDFALLAGQWLYGVE